jgi:hypothetical protein
MCDCRLTLCGLTAAFFSPELFAHRLVYQGVRGILPVAHVARCCARQCLPEYCRRDDHCLYGILLGCTKHCVEKQIKLKERKPVALSLSRRIVLSRQKKVYIAKE